MPLLAKPPACSGCALEHKGEGFAPADGPAGAPFLWVGESLGKVEALTGRPFMGDAGGMLSRLLGLLGWTREGQRIHNAISCRPPGDWFDERAPWYRAALAHCPYLDRTLAEGSPVVITLGGTALRKVMHLEHQKNIRVQDFHGSILRDPTNRYWVIPTYHPSFLQRGAHNLIGTVLWDLQRAVEARASGKPADNSTLIIDPPLDWFRAWVDQVVAARQQSPDAYPLTSDVETPDKAGGKDEGEITAEDRSFQILRQNVTAHTGEGITVPNAGGYIDELKRLYASPGPIWEWNREYDFQRQVAAGFLTEHDSSRVVDLMWLAHVLQSDLPRGLGFWAPFYSAYGPWKHLASSRPAEYAAVDAIQNHRIGFGLYTDLQQLGLFERAMRHTHTLHTGILRPAQLVGVRIDRERLVIFKEELAERARAKLVAIQAAVPLALRPLTPKGGLTRKPLDNVLHVKATAFTRRGAVRKGKPVPEIKQELYARATVIEKLILKEVLVCRTCGAVDVQRRHCCQSVGPAGEATVSSVVAGRRRLAADAPRAQVELDTATVTRWFWQEPFNPDSWQQVLLYIKFRKHAPGRAKKTGQDSTDRETLKRLTKTGDPFYSAVLDYRAINKVKGTYVEGTERRLDSEDRLHPQPSFRPSTMRLSYVNPNITNCVRAGTRIEILRDAVRYPAGVPIEDVRIGDWAYTYDAQGQLTLRRVRNVMKSGFQKLVRVHWRAANKRPAGYVDLTPDHEVRLTTGAYRRATDLRPNDRVLALARFTGTGPKQGYQYIHATGWRLAKQEHRFAYTTITGTQPAHVHHKNEQRGDNRLDNLLGLDVGEHFRLHNTGAGNPRWRSDWPAASEERRLCAGRESRDRSRAADPGGFLKQQRESKRKWYQANRSKAARLRGNHRILHVEPLPHPDHVYDLEIEETHNFIAGELCVHNCIADKDAKRNLAAGFRSCVVAGAGCKLLEIDFSAIEAVETGWCARDPFLMRLARLGIHSYLIALRLKDAPDLSASDDDIRQHLLTIKKKAGPLLYDQVKHTVYGVFYGQTPYGLAATWPDLYPSLKSAESHVQFLFDQLPSVPIWQHAVLDTASATHCLGGAAAYHFTPAGKGQHSSPVVGHPFGYRHWFWSIYTYRRLNVTQYYRLIAASQTQGKPAPVVTFNGQHFRITHGPDANRSIAFYPQSIATGVLKEAMLRLFLDHDAPHYIGEAYYGKTPLRAPIHDSLLLEVPDRQVDRVFEAVCCEMQRPVVEQPCLAEWGMGEALQIGVAAKVGLDWQDTTDRPVATGVAQRAVDSLSVAMEPEDEEDWEDLRRGA